MIVTNNFDCIPEDDKPGLYVTGWHEKVENGITLRSNVKRRSSNGRLTVYYPIYVDGGWYPHWSEVID